MSVAGLERMTTGSVVKRLTLLRHKSGQINFTLPKAGAYAGFLRGGANFKISGILEIHAAKRRAAKLRAFVRGVWGYAPPRKFLKMVQFRAF